MPRIFVLDVPEFAGLVREARLNPEYAVHAADKGYIIIEGQGELTFDRRKCGFKPAVWYGMFTGGIEGNIVEFSQTTVRLTPTDG